MPKSNNRVPSKPSDKGRAPSNKKVKRHSEKAYGSGGGNGSLTPGVDSDDGAAPNLAKRARPAQAVKSTSSTANAAQDPDASRLATSGGEPDGSKPAAAAASPTPPGPDGTHSAAAKRERADALLARLSAKLDKTTDAKKRLKLQENMLRLLPKCTPLAPEASRPPQPAAPAAASDGGASSCSGGSQAVNFPFKLRRTPKDAMAVAADADGPEQAARRRLRQQRFGDAGGALQPETDNSDAAVLVRSAGFGTSEALEKEYLRLTSLPLAADVRPPAVLAQALRRVKDKWLQRPDYAAASEQLKAIRQDLTVQHVRDALTVDVYETHGRLALEADDLAEFRRCHAVLRQLYSEGLPGHPAEFEAYGLLYTQATAAARNTLAMELSRVPHHLLDHPYVTHARDVCAAARSGNYARFIALYDGAPRMSPYIMDRLLGRMRLWALQSSVAAYKPLPLPLEHLAAQLGLGTEEEAADFAEQHAATVDRPSRCLDTRASAAQPLGPQRQPPQ